MRALTRNMKSILLGVTDHASAAAYTEWGQLLKDLKMKMAAVTNKIVDAYILQPVVKYSTFRKTINH